MPLSSTLDYKFKWSFFIDNFSNNGGNGHRGNGGGISDNESDDDAEEGDYTVYECPGLAPVTTFCAHDWWFTRFDQIELCLKNLGLKSSNKKSKYFVDSFKNGCGYILEKLSTSYFNIWSQR